MKAITTKEFISLVAIVITAALLALAVIGGARTTAAVGNDLLLLALTLVGAVVSGINGFGRRTVRAQPNSRRSHRGPRDKVALES